MSAPTRVPPARTRPPARPPEPPSPWTATVGAGVAVLLAGTPVTSVVRGGGWIGYSVVVVAAVVAVGLVLHRSGAVVVAAGQLGAVLLVLTGTFAENGILGLVPGPATWREFGALVAGAGAQIDTGTAPVDATPQILFLVTAAFGLLAVAVHLAAVGSRAPAAAGVPLLAVFAVPAALADDLLPWWAMAAAASGFGLLLVARDGARRQLPGGTAVVVGALVLALGIGSGAGFVGTAGRFEGAAGAGGSGGSIGLSPFTSLRGQLERTGPVELLRVRGLPRATYLRALTLRDYVPDVGWQASRPEPGEPLPGPVSGAGAPAEVADVQIENIDFRDYWLPLYGRPLEVTDLPGGWWAYDTAAGTAYTARPREEGSWRVRAELALPGLAQLRAAEGVDGTSAAYLNVDGVDARVGELAAQVVAGAGTPFDRALALQDYFTGPASAFVYSLETAPGGGDDALVEFLTVGRTGYCEQYASAMAVMLRTVGVPARVAVGFTGGTPVGGYRSVSTADAHAWVEAWFPGVGWTLFDPTPLTDGRAVTPPYILEARAEAAGGPGDTADEQTAPDVQPDLGPSTAPVAPEPDQPADAVPGETGGGLPAWPFVTLLAAGLLALVPAGLRRRDRRSRLAAVSAGGPEAAGAGWAEVLTESADRGVPARPGDTVRGIARKLVREHRLDDEAQRSLRLVVAAVESSWYGEGDDIGPLAEPVRAVVTGIATASPLRLRDRLLPRSVLGRMRTRRMRIGRRTDEPEPDGKDRTAATR